MWREFPYNLKVNVTPGAKVFEVHEGIWRFEIPAGSSKRYRLAQLDDYTSLPRCSFPWSPPLRLSLCARASDQNIPGTWGFGLWNDPFSMGVLSGSGGIRLPVLPNTAWFFFASPPNYLSLNNYLPAQGWLACTFSSPIWPSTLSMLGAPALPLLLFPPFVRLVRRLASRIVRQDTTSLSINPTEWCCYELTWETKGVKFWVNGEKIFRTLVTPVDPLGLVIWVDNQYACVPPSGRMRYGFLPNSEVAWIEIGDLTIERISDDLN